MRWTLSEKEKQELIRLHERIKEHPLRRQGYNPKMNDYVTYSQYLIDLMEAYYESVKRHLEKIPMTEDEGKKRRWANGMIYHNVWSLFNGIQYSSTISSREKLEYRLSFCDLILRFYHAYIDDPQFDHIANIYGYSHPNVESGQSPYYIARQNWNYEKGEYEVDIRDLSQERDAIQRRLDYYNEYIEKCQREGREAWDFTISNRDWYREQLEECDRRLAER